MEKIDNCYKYWNTYIITSKPELYSEGFVKAMANRSWNFLRNIDEDAQRATRIFNNYRVIQEGFYNYDGRLFKIINLTLNEKREQCIRWNQNIFKYAEYRNWRLDWYSNMSSLDWFKLLSEDFDEAMTIFNKVNEEKNIRDFAEKLGMSLEKNFKENATRFLINHCLDLIDETWDVSKYTLSWDLSHDSILVGLKNITKEEFKNRFKLIKKDWLLVMFK